MNIKNGKRSCSQHDPIEEGELYQLYTQGIRQIQEIEGYKDDERLNSAQRGGNRAQSSKTEFLQLQYQRNGYFNHKLQLHLLEVLRKEHHEAFKQQF